VRRLCRFNISATSPLREELANKAMNLPAFGSLEEEAKHEVSHFRIDR
jgi:hypothetical protein